MKKLFQSILRSLVRLVVVYSLVLAVLYYYGRANPAALQLLRDLPAKFEGAK